MIECLNSLGLECKALKVMECSEDCFARIVNPYKYLLILRTLEKENHHNCTTVSQIRKEIKVLIKKYNLDPDVTTAQGYYEDWDRVYREDKRRGKGGGHSEGNTNEASMKQKMKDNRPIETKLTMTEREALREATEKWEAEHGKLERLGRSSMSNSKVDSYTGEPIK